MVCLSPVCRLFVACPTGDKHTISTSLIKPIFSVLAHTEKQFFSKLVFEYYYTSRGSWHMVPDPSLGLFDIPAMQATSMDSTYHSLFWSDCGDARVVKNVW